MKLKEQNNGYDNLNTPVLFLVFNRLETTQRVFEQIRLAKPKRLYISCDGPRPNKLDEAQVVSDVREYILGSIDWDCEVHTNFRTENAGCKIAVSEGISWFFEQEIEGIILEDDCLPDPSFFRFCEVLLEKYRYDNKVFAITGDGRLSSKLEILGDYTYCKYPLIWGWATWARVWQNYDVEMADWQDKRNDVLKSVSNYAPTVSFWRKTFDKVFKGEIDTWDYQFVYTLLKNNGKCIVPKVNLISNIGFGEAATHTVNYDPAAADRPTHSVGHKPDYVGSWVEIDMINSHYDRKEFRDYNIFQRVARKIKRTLCTYYS